MTRDKSYFVPLASCGGQTGVGSGPEAMAAVEHVSVTRKTTTTNRTNVFFIS